MRTQLFGTGGATVSGLFTAGPTGQRRLSPPSPPNTPPLRPAKAETGGAGTDHRPVRRAAGRPKDKGGGGGRGCRAVLRSPVLGCVAESLAPARSTQEMSNFMAKMRG